MLQLGIFNGIDPLEHETLIKRYCSMEEFAIGAAICEKGASGDCMYIVLEGAARVKVTGSMVADLKTGDAFGEICLIDGGLRTASVFAGDRCKLAKMTRDNFNHLQFERPADAMTLLENMLKLMSGRLRKANNVIREVERELRGANKVKSLFNRLREALAPA